MTDPNVKAKIITTLEQRGPLVVSSIAWVVGPGAGSHYTQLAVDELVAEGYVERHEDGKRYQLVDSGPVGPEAA